MTLVTPQNPHNPLSEPRPVCPVSRSIDTLPLCHVDGFEVWRCPESATDFVWPMPDDRALKTLYDREAWFEGGERGGYQNYDEQTAPSLHLAEALLDRFPADKAGLAVLDVGCGYGTHLRLAADRQWKCFGIEPSEHAREVAIQRHGDRMSIVERAEDLLPQRFDLIFMFEVIEHLKDPYPLFYTLFGRDAIGPETLIVITTPNARSYDAITAPSAWAYRHPPSHLVFYSAKSLQILLHRLMFNDVRVDGIVPLPPTQAANFADEAASVNDGLGNFLGIVAEACGSDFKEFMHERYVPGAFWKLTEYEHLPRYGLASTLAQDAKVLDFGCGTGYGSAVLAEVAESVTGLDISEDAINWARATHRHPGLVFDLRSDLGQGLPQASFDLVTCFEMIEHVDYPTQQDTIRSIASLLKPAGKLVISTPDPEFTADYGPNPYHLREMNEAEFTQLLQAGFRYVTMLKQWVRPSILIGSQAMPDAQPAVFSPLATPGGYDSRVGFVAICSNEAFEPPAHFCVFDTTADFNQQTLQTEHRLNRLRFENSHLLEGKEWLEGQVRNFETQALECDRLAAESKRWLESQVLTLEAQLNDRELTMAESKTWLENQVRTLEEQLAERDRLMSESKNWLEGQVRALEVQLHERGLEMAASKSWLESQVQALEGQLAESNRLMAVSRSWLEGQIRGMEAQLHQREQEMAESKTWLEGQVLALETQVRERDQILDETRAWLNEREKLLADSQSTNTAHLSTIEQLQQEVDRCHCALDELLDNPAFKQLLDSKVLELKHFPPAHRE